MFLESILILKSENFKNSFLPCFGDLVAGKSSRKPQSRARGSVLATCSWVEGPIVRGTQRFLRLSSQLPREWDFQSRKTLRNFFKTFGLKCFGGCIWRLTSAAKNACFAQWGLFLKSFSVFLRTFCDCSFSLLSETSQTLRVTHFKLHCYFISSQNHQEKVWVFSSSLHILCFEYYFLAFCVETVFCNILYSNIFLLDCWVWLVVFDADFICFHIVGHIVLTFVPCFVLCWFSNSFGKWVWCFSVLYSICEYESLNMSMALDCLSYITVFLC